jgi:hypothetical protein
VVARRVAVQEGAAPDGVAAAAVSVVWRGFPAAPAGHGLLWCDVSAAGASGVAVSGGDALLMFGAIFCMATWARMLVSRHR